MVGEVGRGGRRHRRGRGFKRGSSPIPSSGWLPALPLCCPRSGPRVVLGPEEPRRGCWPLSLGSRQTSNRSGPPSPGAAAGDRLQWREGAEGEWQHDDQQLNLPKTSRGQKGLSEPQTPAQAGGHGGGWVIGGTHGFHASWRGLPIEDIIAFDFYKYQG